VVRQAAGNMLRRKMTDQVPKIMPRLVVVEQRRFSDSGCDEKLIVYMMNVGWVGGIPEVMRIPPEKAQVVPRPRSHVCRWRRFLVFRLKLDKNISACDSLVYTQASTPLTNSGPAACLDDASPLNAIHVFLFVQ